MYIPKGWHWAFPVMTVLIGFSIHNKFPTWDGAFVLVVLSAIALEWGAYIWQAGVMYQGYLTQLDVKYGTRPAEQAETTDELPPVKLNGYTNFETVSTLPKFDKERSFAVTVLRMMEYNGKADLREERWVKTKKFVRSEFVAMLKVWESYGVIKREADRRNAPYVVANMEAVRIIAQGNPLPRRDLVQ